MNENRLDWTGPHDKTRHLHPVNERCVRVGPLSLYDIPPVAIGSKAGH